MMIRQFHGHSIIDRHLQLPAGGGRRRPTVSAEPIAGRMDICCICTVLGWWFIGEYDPIKTGFLKVVPGPGLC